MDPYLEDPIFWSSFHNRFLVAIADVIASLLQPKYYVEIESKTKPQKVEIPIDLERKERYLQVREIGTDTVITAIELLSPTNKRTGEGRDIYKEKRRSILSSRSHLVELDFLRFGNPMTMRGVTGRMDYRILVSRANYRPTADLYGFTLRDQIPTFSLPLQDADESLAVDLQTIFNGVYDRSSYRSRLNYQNPVQPPALPDPDRLWVQELLKS